MLRIVASYHCIQFQVKLMNQTWENDNKPSFRPNFGPFGTNLGPKIFFKDLTLMLDTAASYHCMQLEKMAKKPCFRPDFGPFGPNSSCQFFSPKIWLCQSLNVMVSYHHVQYQKKLMIQSCKNLVMDRQTDRQTGIGGQEWFHRKLSD